MTITVTPEIEGVLAEEAQKYGTTPELLALETLRERYAERLRVLSNGHSVGENLTLDVALEDLIAEAEALEPQTPRPGLTGPFGEILAEKYRKQGLDV